MAYESINLNVSEQIHLRVLCCTKTVVATAWNLADNYNIFWRLYINERSGAAVLSGDQSYIMKSSEIGLSQPGSIPSAPACTAKRSAINRLP